MTVDERVQAMRDAGFELARRLPRDAELRRRFTDSGWRSGDHIVIALDDERVVDVVARMQMHETGGKAHIVTPHPGEQHGFRILAVRVVTSSEDRPEDAKAIQLAHGASIGMLYSALQPCGTYVPGEWTRELLFEKIDA